MGLFSSKSKSKSVTYTTYTDNSRNTDSAASLGSLAHDNIVLGPDSSYVERGMTGENLNAVLGTVENLSNQNSSLLSQTFDKMVGSVQNSAETAIKTTAEAYAESDDEFRRAIDGIRPLVMYLMFAAVAYFIFKGSK